MQIAYKTSKLSFSRKEESILTFKDIRMDTRLRGNDKLKIYHSPVKDLGRELLGVEFLLIKHSIPPLLCFDFPKTALALENFSELLLRLFFVQYVLRHR